MNKEFIPVNQPNFSGNEKKYLLDCIDTGWVSSEGEYVKKLESQMAEYVGRTYGIAVCNGSVAIDLAIEALHLKAGDEVIMPTFTIISCAAPLLRRGIKPIFVDACLDTWNMDITQLEAKISSKTKAIMVVHIYGLPVDMDPVIELAEKYELILIEDAAEMHGQEYKGRKCGSFGDISIFSFYPNKHITTGEGGLIVTNNADIAEKCLYFRDLCHKPGNRFVHEDLGFNYRMSNLQAAVGVAQFEKINEHIMRKREIGKYYHDHLSDIEHFQLPLQSTTYADNIYWVFGIMIKSNLITDAHSLMKKLESRGIGTRPFFYPMHLQPVMKKFNVVCEDSLRNSELMWQKGFYIPSGLSITDQQLAKVVDIIHEVMTDIV